MRRTKLLLLEREALPQLVDEDTQLRRWHPELVQKGEPVLRLARAAGVLKPRPRFPRVRELPVDQLRRPRVDAPVRPAAAEVLDTRVKEALSLATKAVRPPKGQRHA